VNLLVKKYTSALLLEPGFKMGQEACLAKQGFEDGEK